MNRTRYFPYGAIRNETGTSPTDRRFTGQRRETNTVYNYNARFYHTDIGRMPQADSIVPDATMPAAYNRYAYVVNNPTNNCDPTGHISRTCTHSAWAIYGGAVRVAYLKLTVKFHYWPGSVGYPWIESFFASHYSPLGPPLGPWKTTNLRKWSYRLPHVSGWADRIRNGAEIEVQLCWLSYCSRRGGLAATIDVAQDGWCYYNAWVF